MLPSYRNQSIDLLVVRQKAFKAFIKPFDAPQANHLTGLYMRATLAFDELTNIALADQRVKTRSNKESVHIRSM